MVAAGVVSFRLSRPRGRAPEYVPKRDVYLSVTLAWTLASLLGGTPFLVEGTFHSLLEVIRILIIFRTILQDDQMTISSLIV